MWIFRLQVFTELLSHTFPEFTVTEVIFVVTFPAQGQDVFGDSQTAFGAWDEMRFGVAGTVATDT